MFNCRASTGSIIKVILFLKSSCINNQFILFLPLLRNPSRTGGVSILYLRGQMYSIFRSILFRFDAEKVHHFAMAAFRVLCSSALTRKILSRWLTVKDASLERELFGLHFSNPVGLGAGFDKNACYLRELSTMGFGFVEIGTVTPRPQSGNDKPRLFRLPADKALINRMGFNNDGVEKIASRLEAWRMQHPTGKDHDGLIIGGNIGKNKTTPNDEAWLDYEICFRRLFGLVDYFVVNVSSPNTPGLRELQEKDALGKILSNLQSINSQMPSRKPLLLKISPDLSPEQIDDIVDLALEVGLDGIVATNTTIDRKPLSSDTAQKAEMMGAGGLSGLPLRQKSTEIVRYFIERSGGRIPVIASGGIFTAADAREKFNAGASLVQVWTGFIYLGPAMAGEICRGLK